MSKKTESRVELGLDGKYRWATEVNLYTNPTILIDLLKVMGGIMVGLFLLIVIYGIIDNDWEIDWEWLGMMGQAFFWIIVFMLVLCLLGYYIWVMMSGGRYTVMFEMDETSIIHRQMPKTVKKGKVISLIGTMTALASDDIGLAANANLAGSITEWKTEFKSVRRVIPKPRRHLIKVNELLTKNRVFVDNVEDYNFVFSFIRDHCPNLKK